MMTDAMHGPPKPLPMLLDEALELAKTLESRPDVEQQQRLAEAREIRDRIPGFLREPKGPELLARVSVKELSRAASAWRYGDPSLVFLGPTRAGKSTAAGWLFRRLLHDGVKLGGVPWSFAKRLAWFGADGLSRARREHPLGKGDAAEIISACAASLLVIDDAGWDRDPVAVSDVLAARYEREFPTVITTGKTTAELTAHYGAAVVRRVLESGGKRAIVVDCFSIAEARAEMERRHP